MALVTGFVAMPPTDTATVAIIGFATLNYVPADSLAEMNATRFQRMVDAASSVILNDFSLSNTSLVSGGAPWGDQVAVELFIRCKTTGPSTAQLRIYVPVPFDTETLRFIEDSIVSGVADQLNVQHAEFSIRCGHDDDWSRRRIAAAAAQGAVIDDSYIGFIPRNDAIATAAERVIAFKTHTKPIEPPGGTAYTLGRMHLANPMHHKMEVNVFLLS